MTQGGVGCELWIVNSPTTPASFPEFLNRKILGESFFWIALEFFVDKKIQAMTQ
jgi:hypothetical protein